jgi:hypothetical protein
MLQGYGDGVDGGYDILNAREHDPFASHVNL